MRDLKRTPQIHLCSLANTSLACFEMKSQNYCPEMYSEKNEVLSEESLKLNIHFPVAVRYVWL